MGKVVPFKRRRKQHRPSTSWNFSPKPPKGQSTITLIAIGLSLGAVISGGIIFGPSLIASAEVRGPTYQAEFGCSPSAPMAQI